MKQIPKRIINDLKEGWMRFIEKNTIANKFQPCQSSLSIF